MADEQAAVNPVKTDKKQKKQKTKKAKVVENRGISGVGTDYTVYILNSRERLVGMAAGFLVGFLAAYMYFDSQALGIIVGLIAALKGKDIYRSMLYNKRKKELRLQFRDLLESLSNSYTVGMTANKAFHNAYQDMVTEHGENSYITREVQLICAMHDSQGVEIKDSVNDFAVRSGIDDVKSFAGVFEVSNELGGDIAKVIRETRDMIGDKIEIEMEIQTMVTGQKNQLNVLAIMPIVMAVLTKSFNTGDTGAGTVAIKLGALVLFVLAYWWGTKIVDIKV